MKHALSPKSRVFASLILILLLTSSMAASPFREPAWNSPPQKVHLRLSDVLCQAEWKAGVKGGPLPKTLPCPGSPSTMDGFVRPLAFDEKLEDNSSSTHAFEAHPQKEKDGYITGAFDLYALGFKVQRGDRFKAHIGLLQDANRGRVRFQIIYDQDPIESGDEEKLLDHVKSYDRKLYEVDIDLSRFAGSSGDLILRVESEGDWSQDRAVWADARIEQGSPSQTSPHSDE